MGLMNETSLGVFRADATVLREDDAGVSRVWAVQVCTSDIIQNNMTAATGALWRRMTEDLTVQPVWRSSSRIGLR
jgi:hypothetical protein